MISPETLEEDLKLMADALLRTARDHTFNRLSDNCKFILSEIRTDDPYVPADKKRKEENDRKEPLPLTELVPVIRDFYLDIYDINLYVYRSFKDLTVIDIRYFLKSSLDKEFAAQVVDRQPMSHSKLIMPPFLTDKKTKFDINWEHQVFRNKIRFFITGLKTRYERWRGSV